MKLVYIGEDLSANGFRKVAALYPSAQKVFIPLHRRNRLDVDKIAAYLLDDCVAFSFMSNGAPVAQAISEKLRTLGKTYIVWGGVHATLFPEEAMLWADSVCIGEGDKYDFFPGDLCRNKLMTSEELSSRPFAYNGLDCTIYDNGFKPMTPWRYIKYSGLLYRTLWVRGCPYQCAYCANSSFLKIDPDYAKLRYASVDYIIAEVKDALAHYPFVTTVCFDDDNFIMLPLPIIEEFAEKWQSQVGKPFVVMGMHPMGVTEEKIEVLAEAGMNRVRMGIQSGNQTVLDFYNRVGNLDKIRESADILALAARKYGMVAPNYDIISDFYNNMETLDFLYDLPRPYTLAVFSLRVMPKTRLAEIFPTDKNLGYLDTEPNWYNLTLYLLSIFKPPRWLFNWLKRRQGGVWSWAFKAVKRLFMWSKQWDHLRHGDASKLKGWKAWLVWRIKR